MKNMKKILALVIAVLMIVASVAAFADDQTPAQTPAKDYDYPLTVTGLAQGDTATFYKIIEWVGEAEGNIAGWKVVSTYDSIKNDIIAAVLGTPATATTAKVEPTGITSLLAGKIADLAANGTAGTVSQIENTDPAEYKATLENPAAGMWMALITAADSDTIYNPVFVSADYVTTAGGTVAVSDTYNGETAVAKKSTVTLTKTAANADDYNGDNAKTTAIGDTVTFTVNTQIPGYADIYQNPHFDVVDTLTDLDLKADTVTVTVPAGLTKGNQYTVEATTSGYRISFTAAYLKTLKTATPVTITYDAVVSTTAPIQINEETNDVYIEYSHNPTQEGDYDVKKDTTQHYTFTLDADADGLGQSIKGKKTSELVKIGLDAAGQPIIETTEHSEITDTETWQGSLKGAQFGLYKSDQVTLDAQNKPTAIKEGEQPFKTQTTGTDGRMKFAGLDAGTYYLKELSAPAGFVTQSDIHTIVIAAETETIKVTEWWNGSAWVSTKPTSGTAKEVTYETEILKSYSVTVDGTPAATYTFTNVTETNSNEIQWTVCDPVEKPFLLPNTKGVELPSTGGMGTTILYVGGSILVILAAVLLITKRRMSADE